MGHRGFEFECQTQSEGDPISKRGKCVDEKHASSMVPKVKWLTCCSKAPGAW
jgi:hypothetical protein